MDTRTAPTFSIVMPAFNTAPTINAAIESVLAQTRDDFELLVVDDGSSDGTAARVEPYLHDNRVRLISQPNLGLAGARNTAIEIARGMYASLLDSDDVWLPRYLDVMATALDNNPVAAVAYTDAWVLDDGIRRIARRTAMSPSHPPSTPRDSELFLRALLEFGNFVFSGATIRMSTLRVVGPFRRLEAEDYEMWLRIAARGYSFVRCPETLVIYRRSPRQMTANQERTRRAVENVLRIVEEEYEIPDDIRALAGQRIPLRAFRPGRPRRVPRVLRPLYKALARAHWFYFKPPKPVRDSFPDLRLL